LEAETRANSTAIDQALYDKGWKEKQFKTAIKVDDQTYDSPTHKVDCYKNKVALEIEWNNKDLSSTEILTTFAFSST